MKNIGDLKKFLQECIKDDTIFVANSTLCESKFALMETKNNKMLVIDFDKREFKFFPGLDSLENKNKME